MAWNDEVQINKSEKQQLLQTVAELKQDHRSLDIAILELAEKVHANELQIGRLKRQKLNLKDAITKLESRLIPDLLA